MGNGAPPEMIILIELRSYLSMPGVLLSAVNKVGTAQNADGFFLASSFSSASGWNRGTRSISAPTDSDQFITQVMAKAWNKGRMPTALTAASGQSLNHKVTCCALMSTLAWLSAAPLATPVVPPVYCSSARVLTGSIAGGVTSPSLSVRSSNGMKC